MHPIDHNCPFHGLFMNFSTQIIACCSYRCSYLRFYYHFRPRAESATFLFATMLFCSPQWDRPLTCDLHYSSVQRRAFVPTSKNASLVDRLCVLTRQKMEGLWESFEPDGAACTRIAECRTALGETPDYA